MLTLFPRIRPNPIAPPSLPLAPPAEPKPSEPASELVPLSIEIPTEAASAAETLESLVSANKDSAIGSEVDATTTVSNSDVFGAFLSGMATGNPEPFIVEITAQPARPEPKGKSELSEDVSPGLLERGPELAKPITIAASEDQSVADGSLRDNTVAPAQNPEAASEFAVQGDAGSVSTELVVAAANIFDELDVLHEAAIASSLQGETPGTLDSANDKSSTAQPQSGTAIEAAIEEVGEKTVEEAPHSPAPASIAELELTAAAQGPATEMPAAIPDAATPAEHIAQESAPVQAPTQPMAEESLSEDSSPEIPAPQTTAQECSANGTEAAANEAEPVEQTDVETGTQEITAVPAAPPRNGPPAENHTTPSARSSVLWPKPKRAKGTLFGLARVPEPETMDDSGEVEAYASAAAQAHLDAIDDTFVAHAQLLLKGRERGRVLDIGTGPGQIVIKLGYRLTRWKFVGVDRSATMVEKAMASLATAGELAGRVEFRVADGIALDFPDKSFEMVVCNSVLHHVPDPRRLFAEIARVLKPGGAILLRDLRRPSRPGYGLHVWKHGRHYSGEMRRLFIASVQAAYTEEELQKIVTASPLRDVHVFRHGKSHIGFERPIAIPATSKK